MTDEQVRAFVTRCAMLPSANSLAEIRRVAQVHAGLRALFERRHGGPGRPKTALVGQHAPDRDQQGAPAQSGRAALSAGRGVGGCADLTMYNTACEYNTARNASKTARPSRRCWSASSLVQCAAAPPVLTHLETSAAGRRALTRCPPNLVLVQRIGRPVELERRQRLDRCVPFDLAFAFVEVLDNDGSLMVMREHANGHARGCTVLVEPTPLLLL
jgi:hypothetical protein